MEHAPQILFGPFRVDPHTARLWRDEQEVVLRAKPLAVLHYLADHAGHVVTKAELLKAVWAGTYVSTTVLKVCVREIREALGDEVATPRYVETVGRLGYRFIAPVGSGQYSVGSGQERTTRHVRPERRLVGRETELRHLHGWLESALRGERQVVLVTGEAGIGKTAVVDGFMEGVQATNQVRYGRGQCVEHYGAGEAYLPVLEALGQLCRAPGGKSVLEILSRYAPTWLAQLPALVPPDEMEGLLRKTAGATRERMLREMAETLEALTAEHPLVLVMEDLHWSDVSTLELLAYLARRRERARFLAIGTYRPTEVIVSGHPLKGVLQELQAHGQCAELRLELLSESAVAEYLAGRFAIGTQQVAPFRQLSSAIHQRTDGNALFMVNVVEHVVKQGLVAEEAGQWQMRGHIEDLERSIPESLRRLIERQIERLRKEEQEVLEVASVAGATFAVAAVAAGSKREADAVEEVCEEVTWQGHFIQEEGVEEWPDGTISGRYQFRHALYQSVLYERIAAARRVRLHRQIGERLEQGYGARAREIAAELAVHFERGWEYAKAVQYLQQAGENAVRRSANQEAISLLTKGLELLKALPDTTERAQQELRLQLTLNEAVVMAKGAASAEREQVLVRARELCQQVGETPELFFTLSSLLALHIMRAEFPQARELAEQLLTLAQSSHIPHLLMFARWLMGETLLWMGAFGPAREQVEQGIALYETQQYRPQEHPRFMNPLGPCLHVAALALWTLGYPDQARKRIQEAQEMAGELAQPFALAVTLNFAADLHTLRRDVEATHEIAEQLITLSTEQGFPDRLAQGIYYRGLALTMSGQGEEGLAQMRQGVAGFQATGAKVSRPAQLAGLAVGYSSLGQPEEGLSLLTEALELADKTGERFCEAELYRIKGELVLQSGVRGPESQEENQKAKGKRQKSKITDPRSLIPDPQAEAEACFLKSITVARQQQAKSLELRAVMSLSQL